MLSLFAFCTPTNSQNVKSVNVSNGDTIAIKKDTILPIIIGAENTKAYFSIIENKRIALCANPTSVVKDKHLLDFLLENGFNVKKVFAPEHGFRGDFEPGQNFSNDIDKKTGVKIISLFGKNLKPTPEQIADVDIIIFDMQDVGVRFFTFISTMHNIMEAAGESHKEVLILDRPNPLGDYVDGPIRQEDCKSFVSMHPIPIVHGMTVGELAQMINQEGWLKNKIKCKLFVSPCQNYTHQMHYKPSIKPSPNLPDYHSIRLYPSLCLFEATSISVGRGTYFPFRIFGYPDPKFGNFTFTPKDIKGMQTNPLHKDKICYGYNLENVNPEQHFFTLEYFIKAYNFFPDKDKFVTRKQWLSLLWGNKNLLNQLNSGMSEQEIKLSYKKELDDFLILRKKYLIYR